MVVCMQCDLYLEVSSKDYLIASDNHVRLLFGSWLETPQSKQNLGEKFSGKTSFQFRAGPVKRTETS